MTCNKQNKHAIGQKAYFLQLVILVTALLFGNITFAESLPAPVRAVHIVASNLDMSQAIALADAAHQEKYNTVVILLTKQVMLDDVSTSTDEKVWTIRDLASFAQYCKGLGLEVVPEIKLLTHQHLFPTISTPLKMFNSATYDPDDEGVYAAVYRSLDLLIREISPKAVHIGHDEVAGHRDDSRNKWLKPGEQVLSAEQFLKDTLRIHDFLKKRNIETWMWGDMLISPAEFPGMRAGHLHGMLRGYGKPLRDKLPKDIVITDWHYFDDQAEFPSLNVLQEEGFRVIGATWVKEKTTRNFSKYAASHHAYGMMATTWYNPTAKWYEVLNIIEASGSIIFRDFPDVQ